MKQLRGFQNTKNTVHSSPNHAQMDGTQNVLNEAMKKYGGMSEDALTKQLMQSVKAQKESGSFDQAQLLSFVNTISPHLNDEQRVRMEKMIELLSKNEQ